MGNVVRFPGNGRGVGAEAQATGADTVRSRAQDRHAGVSPFRNFIGRTLAWFGFWVAVLWGAMWLFS